MGYFEFPHTRTYDNDLGWLIWAMKKLIGDWENFSNLNSIKFADPINWTIDRNYEPAMIVVDAEGNGYISRKAVPAGVPLSNDEYWTQIFNFGDITETIRENIAYNNGSAGTAGKAFLKDDLVWWNGEIYIVLYNIAAGTAFIEGTNVQRFTVDDKINLFRSMISDLQAEDIAINTRIDDEITAREAADTEIRDDLADEIQNRTDADDSIIADLQAEADARAAEDAQIIELIQDSSIFINVKEYGAIGDGIVDDTIALNMAFAAAEGNRSTIWFPDGVYIITSRVRVYSNTRILFDSNASLQLRRVTSGSFGPALCFGEYGNESFAASYEGTHDVIIENMKFNGGFDAAICTRSDTHGGGTVALGACKNITIRNSVFENCYNDHYIDIAGSDNVHIENCRFTGGGYVGVVYSYEAINTDFMTAGGFPHYGVHDNKPSKNVWITGCIFENFYGSAYAIGNHSTNNIDGYLLNITIEGNEFDNMSKCIRFLHVRNTNIINNRFNNVGRATEDSYAHPIRIFDCNRIKIHSNMFVTVETIDAIYIQTSNEPWCYSIDISENMFYRIGNNENDRTAIHTSKIRMLTCCNNIFQNITGRPITLETVEHGNISNNVGNSIGTGLDTVTAINLVENCRYLTIVDNMFSDCPGDVVRVGAASNCIRRNNLQTAFTAF